MQFKLGQLQIDLRSNSPLLEDNIAALFEGWPLESSAQGDIELYLELVDHLPPLPASPAHFVDYSHTLPDDVGRLSVYQTERGLLLHFAEGALVRLPAPPFWSQTGRSPDRGSWTGLHCVLTAQVLRYGRLDDVVFSSLAPLLRRADYYLIHAFSASLDGRAILLVGPSGSGKTTTGIRLVQAGWGYLANDTALLQVQTDAILAWPVPGGLSLTARTLALLPSFAGEPAILGPNPLTGKAYLPVEALTIGWSDPAPVAALVFPRVSSAAVGRLSPLRSAEVLARLLESSLDRWDSAALEGHVNALQSLSGQAHGYELVLGQAIDRLPNLLAETLLSPKA